MLRRWRIGGAYLPAMGSKSVYSFVCLGGATVVSGLLGLALSPSLLQQGMHFFAACLPRVGGSSILFVCQALRLAYVALVPLG